MPKFANIKSEYENISNYRTEVLDKIQNGEIWHPALLESDFEDLKAAGIYKPEGTKYDEFLSSKHIGKDYILEPKVPTDIQKVMSNLDNKYDPNKQQGIVPTTGNQQKDPNKDIDDPNKTTGKIFNINKKALKRLAKVGVVVLALGATAVITGGLGFLGAAASTGVGYSLSAAGVNCAAATVFGLGGLVLSAPILSKAVEFAKKKDPEEKNIKNESQKSDQNELSKPIVNETVNENIIDKLKNKAKKFISEKNFSHAKAVESLSSYIDNSIDSLELTEVIELQRKCDNLINLIQKELETLDNLVVTNENEEKRNMQREMLQQQLDEVMVRREKLQNAFEKAENEINDRKEKLDDEIKKHDEKSNKTEGQEKSDKEKEIEALKEARDELIQRDNFDVSAEEQLETVKTR